MLIFKTVEALQSFLQKKILAQNTIGFVPTMGALHQGHLSLMLHSQKQCSITVVSIFINPTQFNNPVDFEKYPQTLEQDKIMLESIGITALFLPTVAEIYPNGYDTKNTYPLGFLDQVLEAAMRPGHFQGVCQVVDKLLQIVQPTCIFMGEKDYQQCLVVLQLLLLKKIPTLLKTIATTREADGLAMSSRNLRLQAEDRTIAPHIYQQLLWMAANWKKTDLEELKQVAAKNLLETGFSSVDYVAICHAENLQPILKLHPATPAIALIAATINGVRLIDNLILNPIPDFAPVAS